MESRSALHKINYLNSELQALYHRMAVKHGISDSVSIVLYNIYDAGGDACMLRDIYTKSGISKQTVNSAIRGLEAEGILYLEAYNGRSKRVILTEEGKEFVKRTTAVVFEAEQAVFDSWTQEEIDNYIRLTEKFKDGFKEKTEDL